MKETFYGFKNLCDCVRVTFSKILEYVAKTTNNEEEGVSRTFLH